jgi:acyl-CoA synthetase (AMP-forming)/AMP-acid ligase II
VLQAQAAHNPEALAMLAPGRAPLTYGRLLRQVEETVQTLRGLGLQRQDRLALVLPPGPEMAVACLAVAAGATGAPLNPAASADEFDVYLTTLRPAALLLESGLDCPARAVAQARHLPVIELGWQPDTAAGLFHLSAAARPPTLAPAFAAPDDVAFVLPTSGTTARPKIVPLTHANVCIAAANLAAALALEAHDRCLNMAPLFHTYGLVAATLTSLVAGASVVYPPGFSGPQFFAWLAAFRPTWYQAVPAMHQAILAHAAAQRDTITAGPLRFIRTGTAPLPVPVRTALEEVFHAPVVEVYGTVGPLAR